MIAGVLTLVVGFVIMSMDSTQHGFGFMGLTLGPIVVMAGFVIEIVAILRKPTKYSFYKSRDCDSPARIPTSPKL